MYNPQKILVGIAAYNAEKNIEHILHALLHQNQSNFLLEILVFSDNSSDKTVDLAKQISDSKIRVIDNRNRAGFAGAVKYILKEGKNYDATVVLNDDIFIHDDQFLAKLIKPLISNGGEIGLITGNPVPQKPGNFVESMGTSSFNIYNRLRYLDRDGNNKWTCDGKILAFSRKFIDQLEFPEKDEEMGNVDGYVYFSCIQNNLKYVHVKDAVVYYKMPSTFSDYLKWDSRNKSNQFILRKKFGTLVDQEYKIPKSRLVFSSLVELFKNPLGIISLYFLRFYSKMKAKRIAENFDSRWEVITTTKDGAK